MEKNKIEKNKIEKNEIEKNETKKSEVSFMHKAGYVGIGIYLENLWPSQNIDGLLLKVLAVNVLFLVTKIIKEEF